jgi:hypothetical protein
MSAVSVTPADLTPFADIDPDKATAMINDALALAALVAPCINEEDFAYPEAALAIIRGAILRWHEAGRGAYSQQTVGPFTGAIDTRVERRSMFQPSEITDLQKLCAGDATGIFGIDTVGTASIHDEACSLYFGATYCSCGADLAGFPLWGSG